MFEFMNTINQPSLAGVHEAVCSIHQASSKIDQFHPTISLTLNVHTHLTHLKSFVSRLGLQEIDCFSRICASAFHPVVEEFARVHLSSSQPFDQTGRGNHKPITSEFAKVKLKLFESATPTYLSYMNWRLSQCRTDGSKLRFRICNRLSQMSSGMVCLINFPSVNL